MRKRTSARIVNSSAKVATNSANHCGGPLRTLVATCSDAYAPSIWATLDRMSSSSFVWIAAPCRFWVFWKVPPARACLIS
jgi:hypothetical protein